MVVGRPGCSADYGPHHRERRNRRTESENLLLIDVSVAVGPTVLLKTTHVSRVAGVMVFDLEMQKGVNGFQGLPIRCFYPNPSASW
jgi:hypothetical protein